MFCTKYLSPFRYPGSKQSIVRYIYEILKRNKIEPTCIVEPFAGSATVALHLLYNKVVKNAIISDKDLLIYSFWKTLKDDPSYIISFISEVKITLENFYKYKNIARNANKTDIYKLAETCIFLNRTSFSGILTEKVGPIGGKHQQSDYPIDCRFMRKSLLKRIENIRPLFSNITVLNHSWKRTLDYCTNKLSKTESNKIFYYFDPPFYNKAGELYNHYFSKTDHVLFCNNIINIKSPWILSYDNAPEIKNMYKNIRKRNVHIDIPYSINYGAQRIEKELIITPLIIPRIK